MKKIFVLCSVVLMVACAAVLTACGLFGKSEGGTQKKYVISFYSDGEVVSEVTTAGKEEIALPDARKAGYDFLGWYFFEEAKPGDDKLTAEYYIGSTLTHDVSVYALFAEQTALTLNESELTLYSGDNYTLWATVMPESKWMQVECNSTDPTVVGAMIVSEEGDVLLTTGVSGQATVTLRLDGKVAQCVVTVQPIEVEIFVGEEKVSSVTTDAVSFSRLKWNVDPLEYVPDNKERGMCFSGWFINKELTQGLPMEDPVKKGDKIYGAWLECAPSDFVYSEISGGGVDVTKYKQRHSYLILPSVINNRSVKEISSGFFRDLYATRYLYIPASVERLYTRSTMSLRYLDVSTENANYKSVDGVLFNKSGTDLLYYPSNKEGAVYRVPDGVECIFDDAFSGCGELSEVVLCSGMESIGSNAFRDCANLTVASLPDSVSSLAAGAFNSCSSLERMAIPAGVTVIRSNLFYGCSALTEVTFAGAVTEIERDAFYGCESLDAIRIPASVTTIAGNPFAGCESLTAIEVETGNESFSIVDGALYSADGLRFICYPAKRSALTFTVRSGVEMIEDYAFFGAPFVSITVPDSVNLIGEGVFAKCAALESLTLPMLGSNKAAYNIEPFGYYFGKDPFEGGVVIGQSTTTAGGQTTIYNRYIPTCLANVTLTGGHVGYSSFISCTMLRSVTIGAGVTSIGNYAFAHCYGLTEVIIEDGCTVIYGYAFLHCLDLEQIIIPSSVTQIEGGTFYNANKVTIYCEASSKPSQYKEGWNKTYFGGDYEEVPTYWYSESEPEEEGLYWHYYNNTPTKW